MLSGSPWSNGIWVSVSRRRPSRVQTGAAGPPAGQLLRYRNGRPITYRRYDHLWSRIGTHLPWWRCSRSVPTGCATPTLTWVERNFGHAVARAYAGHTDSASDAGTTTTYIRASMHEVAAALATMVGEPHPLA